LIGVSSLGAIQISLFSLVSLFTASTFVMPPVVASPSATALPGSPTSPSSSALPSSKTALTDAEFARVKGDVGIAIVDSVRKKQYMHNADQPFPMQSVCKLPLSIAILRLADAGKLKVEDKITVHRSDISTYNSPIKEQIKGKQSDFTIRELITRAIRDSDNTACDVLIKQAGGAPEVTRILTEAGIKGVRIDRPEGTLQPDSLRITTFLADPRDTALPERMAELLQQLYSGKLLSEKSKALVMEDMFKCKTGPNRLKAGLPDGWNLAHKTGTGADVSGQNAGTNDVGILVGPKGEVIYAAVFIKGSRAKIEVREALMAKVAAKAVAGEL
jgi:beta-lactamase class A